MCFYSLMLHMVIVKEAWIKQYQRALALVRLALHTSIKMRILVTFNKKLFI